jgi:hypothetical protein
MQHAQRAHDEEGAGAGGAEVRGESDGLEGFSEAHLVGYESISLSRRRKGGREGEKEREG